MHVAYKPSSTKLTETGPYCFVCGGGGGDGKAGPCDAISVRGMAGVPCAVPREGFRKT
jgi:hypothetical protein